MPGTPLEPREAPGAVAPRGLAERLRAEPGALQRMLCAALAWSVTVAPAAFVRSGSAGSRALAIAALVAGVVGPGLTLVSRRVARHVGISVFLALSVATWLVASSAIHHARIDSTRAAIGALAWGVYGFAWGEAWSLRFNPELDPNQAVLRARDTLPPFASPIAGVGVVVALVLMMLAWRVADPTRGLIAHAAAIGAGVAVVASAATVAVTRRKYKYKPDRAIPKHAGRSLLFLAAAAIIGATVLILRR